MVGLTSPTPPYRILEPHSRIWSICSRKFSACSQAPEQHALMAVLQWITFSSLVRDVQVERQSVEIGKLRGWDSAGKIRGRCADNC